ncbi:hypothetical protein EJ05DRAFT_476525 [Pseudovirgaria hyperparasitica]|uniref:Uncharacterized protein n=1 Tax=Pseudovirgaria hyperparasitica TaxID=470096 RepID=A0A6A6W5W2_9PEZI|nr:uncharacterized protein EJ05DRAFT_476525 [Pseudovirgaria hyperparasitica]KAF2758272.1 hypothetical protein EJ05DRAFT_476525 [Pseudovirgaria hyperparasitica]
MSVYIDGTKPSLTHMHTHHVQGTCLPALLRFDPNNLPDRQTIEIARHHHLLLFVFQDRFLQTHCPKHWSPNPSLTLNLPSLHLAQHHAPLPIGLANSSIECHYPLDSSHDMPAFCLNPHTPQPASRMALLAPSHAHIRSKSPIPPLVSICMYRPDPMA